MAVKEAVREAETAGIAHPSPGERYAGQDEEDYGEFTGAIRAGRLRAVEGA